MTAKHLEAGLLAVALAFMIACPSMAQQRLQTPEGRQTVAPSDMPQQPSLGEEFSDPRKINERTSPPATGPDMPGIPGVEPPGTIYTAPGDPSTEGRMKPGEAGQEGNVATPRSGGLVLPEGIPSSVRIGPVQPIPTWQRAFIVLFLVFQLIVLCVVAVALQVIKRHNEDEFQHGHAINPETTEATMGPIRPSYVDR